jgi:hypothetical protein
MVRDASRRRVLPAALEWSSSSDSRVADAGLGRGELRSVLTVATAESTPAGRE